MIKRTYGSQSADILYHYCSADTFLAVCSGGNIRYSDLNSMNDSQEMKWGYSIWEQAATRLFPIVGQTFLDKVDEIIHGSFSRSLGLVACFSKSGDVLSQWRAYADNGGGYAIGFDATVLGDMASTPLEVLYDRNQQIEEVYDAVAAIHFTEMMRDVQGGSEFFDSCATLYFHLAALKNPGFAEEQEVRLLYSLGLQTSGSGLKLQDGGGYAFGRPVMPKPVSFFMRDGSPVPFLDRTFIGSGRSAIREVIVGPKNPASISGVSIFMETLGHADVEVKRSQIPFR